jgi:hypothetical protein
VKLWYCFSHLESKYKHSAGWWGRNVGPPPAGWGGLQAWKGGGGDKWCCLATGSSDSWQASNELFDAMLEMTKAP